jgi:ferredoxin
MATGACVHTAPGVFAIDDDAVVAVVGDPDASAAAVRLAVEECPMAALDLIGDGPD